MKILILGSEGFIGNRLVRFFQSLQWEVYGCDLVGPGMSSYTYFRIRQTPDGFEAPFKANNYEACINAAGSGSVSNSVQDPVKDFQANTVDTLKVLEAIRKYNAHCKYLHISSAAVYGNPVELPVREDAACNPLSPYGWHKLMAEEICREYHALYQLKIVIVRPFSIYGSGLKKQLFWDIYRKYIANPELIELWGTGDESRDFIYIDDVLACLQLVLHQAKMKAEVFNIASGKEVLIKDLVQELFSHMPTIPRIFYNNKKRDGDPLHWKADISKIESLGFSPSVKLDEGIHNVAAWLQSGHGFNL